MVLLLALLALWGGWFIYRTSFVSSEGRRFFCLFDDAMISMTYARNLVEGYGLNWARGGEPVEGFTHPLWLLPMIAANALPLPLEVRSLPVQLLSLLLLAASAVAARKLVLDHFSTERTATGMPAAVLTAFYYPLSYWALMGMETGLQALLAILAVQLALDVTEAGCDRHLALWLVCAAACLLRMDMLLMVLAVQAYVLIRTGAGRSWRLGLALFLVITLGYGLFRWLYFQDVLPNTYYLKLTGVAFSARLLKGLSMLGTFLRDHLLVLLPVGLGVVPLMRRHPRLVLPVSLFVLYCAYSVYVGGDAWDLELNVRANRYIAFVMPQVFVLLNALINRVPAAAARYAAPAVTGAALLLLNGLWLSEKAGDNWQNLLVTIRPPAVGGHQAVMDQLHILQRRVEPGAKVASTWAGIPSYFTDYQMIDVLGYNDRRIARMESQVELNEDQYLHFRPGHNKWNLGLLMKRRRPDAFFQIWGVSTPEELARRMTRAGYRNIDGFWLHKDSPRIRWPEGREPVRKRKARR
ncbi:MAG TPA: hypothetical protein VN493_29650 [Thermoanaerobaculia bacterium]|nr:hypothetical protein [Thermoanaerobaculia bacterium]